MSKLPPNNTNDSNMEKSNGLVISRRTFLGISATTAAALTAAYFIDWPGINFGTDPMDNAEGVLTEKWVMTSCLNCPTRCAIKVRVVNDKAVRIIGNDISEYSNGKTCPRSHIGLQVLYNPERITKPLKRKSGVKKGKNEDLSWEDQWEETTWQDALGEIAGRIPANPDRLLIIQGLNTTSDEDLIYRFAKSFGASKLLREDTLEKEADNKGKELANISTNTGYDLENANYILSFGADILESETPLSRNLNLWGYIRRERPNRARVVVIDPRYSVTASKADEWIPINPGTEGLLAMAIAHVIVDENLYSNDFTGGPHASGFDDYKAEAARDEYSPANIAGKTGISADDIRRIAREFASYKPAIAWSGAGATSWPHGTNASYAILCLNALVGSIDVQGGLISQDMPQYTDISLAGDDPEIVSLRQVKEDLSNISVIIGFNNNLIMSVPNTKVWDEALAKDGYYYIHIASAHTEMAQYADIILPSCTYLEEWAYETAPPGSGKAEVKLKQPVIETMEDSKPTAQIIFDLVDRIAGTVAARFDKDSIIDSTGVTSDPEGFVKFRTGNLNSLSWNTFKKDGVWINPSEYEYGKYNDIFQKSPKVFVFDMDNLKADNLNSEFQGSNSNEALVLTTYHPVLDIRNGNQNYPWAQEIFLVMHGYGWNNFVEMNKEDADDRGISNGDMVKVKSQFGEIKIKARVFEGIKPGTVAIALGQGHYQCGEWADGIGENPNGIIGTGFDELSGQPCFGNTKVEID